MKKVILSILGLFLWCSAFAQGKTEYTKDDTLRGQLIVDTYLSFVDFDRILSDSTIFVTTKIIDRSNPTDTMYVYHWYGKDHRSRIEMYQNGQLESGYYSNGTTLFRAFNSNKRAWVDMAQHSYYDNIVGLDPRGALYDWRSKGAEIVYTGDVKFQGQEAMKVFVTCPELFDRYYFFEKNTGLLFLTKEEDHIYGDAEPTKNSTRIDWRGWHQFSPLKSCLLPTEESYQYKDQIVLIFRTYKMVPFNEKTFTEDYSKRP